MALKTKVLYEFRIINTDQVLVLDKPAQITFQLIGVAGQGVVINNTYNLLTRTESLQVPFKAPWELVLENNVNEIDITNYVIRFIGTPALYLIIKYFEQPDK
tara:strand:+ start:126 stop:431 length:306 start_codon:yes stop_codon:yes gene_type:complete